MIESLLVAATVLGLLVGFWLLRRTKPETQSREVLLGRAFGKLLDGEREEVLGEMRELYQRTNQDVGVGVALGSLFRHAGKIQMAIRVHRGLTSRVDLEPEIRALILTELMADYLAGGLLARAREALEEALRLKPADELMSRYGERALIQLRDWAGARRIVSEYGRHAGVEVKARVAMIHNDEGVFLREHGNLEGAMAAFKKATGEDSLCLPAHLNICRQYRRAHKPLKAHAYLKKKVPLFEGYEWLVIKELRKIAIMSEDQTIFTQAVENRLMEDPADWRSRSLYGTFLMEIGNFDEASEQLMLALDASPQTLLLHQKLWSLMLRGEGDPQGFRDYYRKMSKDLIFSDPYECRSCGFHSALLLWRCPSCHRMKPFGERKI